MNKLHYEDQLFKIFNNVNDWLKFAEAKNLGLLTLNIAVAFGFTQIDFPNGSVFKYAGYIFLFFAVLSFIPCLISLFPIVSKIERQKIIIIRENNQEKEIREDKEIKKIIDCVSNCIDTETSFENIHFYGYLRGIDENEFQQKLFQKMNCNDAFTQYEIELVTQILYNSRITWLKYQLFKIGAFFFLIGIAISVFALPVLGFIL